MKFCASIMLVLASLLVIVSANSIYFMNLDDTWRTICFTADNNPNSTHFSENLDNFRIPPHAGKHYGNIPALWSGTFHSILDGQQCSEKAVIGEVTFQGSKRCHLP